MKVAVVDDDPDILTVVRMIAVTSGIVAIHAGSIEEARRLDWSSVNLCITDWMMGVGDGGMQLIVWLRDNHPSVPVMVLTSADVARVATALESEGFQDVTVASKLDMASRESLIPLIHRLARPTPS